jgi:hypothetical protein
LVSSRANAGRGDAHGNLVDGSGRVGPRKVIDIG